MDATAARALESAKKSREEEEEAHRHAIVQKVLSRQPAILDGLRAALLEAVPDVVKNVLEMATGAKGSPSVQFDAGKWVLDKAAGSALVGASGPLAELPLDQLETVLRATLQSTQELRSITVQAQRIEVEEEALPTSGSDASESGPPG